MKSRTAIVIDILFLNIVVGIISLIWSRSFLHELSLIMVVVGLTMFILNMILLLKHRLNRKKVISRKEKAREESFSRIMMNNSDEENLILMSDIIKKSGKKIRSTKKYLIAEHEDGRVIRIHSRVTSKKLTIDNVKNILNTLTLPKNGMNLIVVGEMEGDAKKLSERASKNIFITTKAFFKKFGKENYTEKVVKISKKENLKKIYAAAFNRKKAGRYFGIGIMFSIFAFFMRYNVYYLIWTSIMFLFALFSLFKKDENVVVSAIEFPQLKENRKMALTK